MKFTLILLYICYVYASRRPTITPVVSCQINTATQCNTYFGYVNDYSVQRTIPVGLFNWLNELPLNQGQPTLFKANSRVDKIFNITRPCKKGPLLWTVIDPHGFKLKFALADTKIKNTCGVISPPVSAPISVPIAEPISVPVSAPISVPVAEPISVPVSAPISVPVSAPISVPVAEPISAPVESPMEVPIEAPISTPAESPIEVPVSAPIEVPVSAPVSVPISTPIAVPISVPIAVPVSPPINPPVTLTCPIITVPSCTIQSDCPKYYGCISGQCKAYSGLACDNGVDCLSSNCTTSNCQCNISVQKRLDASCPSGCAEGGATGNLCIPTPRTCTTTNDCNNINAPYCVNGYCHDYSCIDPICKSVKIPTCGIGRPLCPSTATCSSTTLGYCIGQVGGICVTTSDCAAGLTCSGCKCV